ncbi:MAG: hypothetical protein A2Y14_04595 [Verrucomicrobia bacterium GWF2_51_19]|nr:MAG: hypothetical protein A2Y14_04595 [Verrucomicrobia bacterium GWF2_51_19]HCJ12313.1 iron ABC transporter substrate-binding protein [Opitutae bacterium]
MRSKGIILILIALVIALPLVFRSKKTTVVGSADDTVVVVTPHVESIRYETEQAFKRWYKEKTGRTVTVDWRFMSGASDMMRYLYSMYTSSFRYQWEQSGKAWSQVVQAAIFNTKIDITQDTLDAQVRKAFLESDEITCGMDVVFGGGVSEFKKSTDIGLLDDHGLFEKCPEYFTEDAIPATLAGESLWDPHGRWVGVCLTVFGIVYNKDRLKALNFNRVPDHWTDLTDPKFFKELAIVDPGKSSVVFKTFEVVIQEQMLNLYTEAAAKGPVSNEKEQAIVREGWLNGLRVLQKMCANTRYYSDASTKTPLDVANGNCAVGIVIDFYGRYYQALLATRAQSERLGYVNPVGSFPSPDPIAVLRGAPNKTAAQAFVEFVISLDGQKILDFKVGTPGGPEKYAVCRAPIRKDFYINKEYEPYRLDCAINPYARLGKFAFHDSWTRPAMEALRFITKVAFMDVQEELSAAWKAISLTETRNPKAYKKAMAVFSDFSNVNYDKAISSIREIASGHDPLREIQLQNTLASHFRKQFERARALALGK